MVAGLTRASRSPAAASDPSLPRERERHGERLQCAGSTVAGLNGLRGRKDESCWPTEQVQHRTRSRALPDDGMSLSLALILRLARVSLRKYQSEFLLNTILAYTLHSPLPVNTRAFRSGSASLALLLSRRRACGSGELVEPMLYQASFPSSISNPGAPSR